MRFAALGAALLVASIVFAGAQQESYDLIIHDGRVIDGTGNPWFHADVGVRGKKVVAVGDLSQASAKRRLDATNRIVSPGFIDMHSHASWNYLVDSRAVSKVTQGVTLEIEGEGHSVAPLNDAMAAEAKPQFDRFGVANRWRTLDEFFRVLEAHPGTINFATHIGTANVRIMTVGYDDRPATDEELEQMGQIVDQAMREGAMGVYSALMYAPDRYNRTNELIAMAKVASKYGGYYHTHPRSEGDDFRDSLDEVFSIAREANIPAHNTHFKVAYVQNWGRMQEAVDLIQDARAEGLQITADIYPYEQGATGFTALLPPWVQDGGREAMLRRLSDKATRERIKEELSQPAEEWENEYLGAGGGPKGITLIDARGNAKLLPYQGMTLFEIGQARNQDPRDSLFDIILAGGAGLASVINDQRDIVTALQEPWVAFGSDGETVAPDGPLSVGLVHPRGYGTYPRYFGRYVREMGVLTLEDAVRRATSLPAQILSIRDRGLLREGFYADITVFDADTIVDTATYEKPHQIAKGIYTVVVNGEIVVDNGKITDARPGMVVRGPGYKASPPNSGSAALSGPSATQAR
jgi:dihydroorotase/N-acyl-D-amino-acid deacylase